MADHDMALMAHLMRRAGVRRPNTTNWKPAPPRDTRPRWRNS